MLDGSAVVHFLSITNITTFNEYIAGGVFVPHIMTHLDTVERAYVVWDSYITSSMKESAREKRGKGIRRKVVIRTSCNELARFPA